MSWIRSNAIFALSFGLAACCIAGLGFKTHCLVNGVWYDLIQYSTGCYSDAVPFWGLRGVAAGQIPYFDARIEYPVLTGALIWLEGIITRSIFGSDAIATNFLIVVVLANAVLAFLVLMMLRRFELPRARLWAWAASPLLLLYIGQNWDMLAVGLTVCALWMARNDRLFEATILAGLGASAKLYPALVVPVLCLQALSLGGTSPISQRLTRALAVGATGAGAWLIVNAPVAILASDNWLEFYRFSSERGTTAASIWGLLESSELLSISPNLRNLIAMGSVVVGTIAILVIGSRRHSAHLWTLSVPIIAWFVLMNKVYSPQFDLWLYPLFLLTIRRTAPIVIFALGSILAFYSELWWFSFQEGGPIALVD